MSIEVQENWLDIPDTIANDVFGNESNEWKEFLINSDSSTGNAEIHSSDSVPEIIAFSKATQKHDNYTKQLVNDCNENDYTDGWSLIII